MLWAMNQVFYEMGFSGFVGDCDISWKSLPPLKNGASFWMMIFTPTKIRARNSESNRTNTWWETLVDFQGINRPKFDREVVAEGGGRAGNDHRPKHCESFRLAGGVPAVVFCGACGEPSVGQLMVFMGDLGPAGFGVFFGVSRIVTNPSKNAGISQESKAPGQKKTPMNH